MDTFKQELKILLARYPQVKNVRYTIEETVSAGQELVPMMPALQTGVTPVDTKPQTPYDKAMSTADATIAGIISRTTGKMTITES